MRGSIRISEKHGVNPAIPLCFFCGEDKNEILLLGKLPGDAQAPHRAVFDRSPCDKCAGYMELGVMLIKCKDGGSTDDPHRLGRLVVIKDEAVRRLPVSKGMVDHLIKARMGFVEESVWSMLGIDEAGTASPGEVKKAKKRVAKKASA